MLWRRGQPERASLARRIEENELSGPLVVGEVYFELPIEAGADSSGDVALLLFPTLFASVVDDVVAVTAVTMADDTPAMIPLTARHSIMVCMEMINS